MKMFLIETTDERIIELVVCAKSTEATDQPFQSYLYECYSSSQLPSLFFC